MTIIDTENTDSNNSDGRSFIGMVDQDSSFVVGFDLSLDKIVKNLQMGKTSIAQVIEMVGPKVGKQLAKLLQQQNNTPEGRC